MISILYCNIQARSRESSTLYNDRVRGLILRLDHSFFLMAVKVSAPIKSCLLHQISTLDVSLDAVQVGKEFFYENYFFSSLYFGAND